MAAAVLAHAPRFVCGILGATCVLDSSVQMKQVWEQLRRLEGENGFVLARQFFFLARDAISASGYRDVKCFIAMPVFEEPQEPQGPRGARSLPGEEASLIVELQLILREFYEEKEWMHVPYEIRRGSFDWPHLH
jgi:hypothetical protein